MKLLRWVLVLPAAYLAWLAALLVGMLYLAVLDAVCPPESVVSGLCTAPWYEAAFQAGVVGGAAIAAALVMAAVALVAPSHQPMVSGITFALGSAAALYLARATGEWGAGAAAVLTGAAVLVIVLRACARAPEAGA